MSVLILSLLTVFFSSGSGQSSPSFITYVLTPKGLEEPSILPCSKSALQKGDALSPPCCFREIQCVSRSQCRLLNFIQFSASDGEGNGGVIQHILKGTVPSHIEIPFQNSIGSLPDFRRQPLELSRIEFAGRFNLRDFSNSLAYGSSSLK